MLLDPVLARQITVNVLVDNMYMDGGPQDIADHVDITHQFNTRTCMSTGKISIGTLPMYNCVGRRNKHTMQTKRDNSSKCQRAM